MINERNFVKGFLYKGFPVREFVRAASGFDINIHRGFGRHVSRGNLRYENLRRVQTPTGR